MENAADALRIAAWVLIFIVALSVSINALTQAKQSADMIITYNDREYDYSYMDGSNSGKNRTVNFQMIIPTIYRAYKENYKIVFDENTMSAILPDGLYGKWDAVDREYKPVYYIDLEKESISNIKVEENDDKWLTLRDYFINRILYGTDGDFADPEINKKCQAQLTKIDFNDTKYPINNKGIYGIIKDYIESQDKILVENLGIYYQEEATNGATSTPNANKTEKRVITYILKDKNT